MATVPVAAPRPIADEGLCLRQRAVLARLPVSPASSATSSSLSAVGRGSRPRPRCIAELEGIVAAGKHSAFIVDDNLIGNKKAIKEVLRDVVAWQEAHGYPLMFATEASIDLAEDRRVDAADGRRQYQQRLRRHRDAERGVAARDQKDPEPAQPRRHHARQGAPHPASRDGGVVRHDRRLRQRRSGIFAAQSRFVAQARIVSAMVNMLVAIPADAALQAACMARAGSNAGDQADFGAFGTNVMPLRIGRDGTARRLCRADARSECGRRRYFGRLDALYLDARLRIGTSPHPLSAPSSGCVGFRLNARLLLGAVAIFAMLMHGVPDPALRREYRRRTLRVAWRRRDPEIIQGLRHQMRDALSRAPDGAGDEFGAAAPGASRRLSNAGSASHIRRRPGRSDQPVERPRPIGGISEPPWPRRSHPHHPVAARGHRGPGEERLPVPVAACSSNSGGSVFHGSADSSM